MEQRLCRNKKCRRPLPDGYKHKYCERCRNEHAIRFRNGCKNALGVAVMVGGVAATVLTKGKINITFL